ncbi:MAG: SMC family ATPase [Sulfolobales archaeon]
MFIEEVHIKNILSHRESVVRFRRGLNVIIGPNGAGKSTIIDSIVYALLSRGRDSEEVMRTSKNNMLRIGSSRGEIKVVLSIGGHRYEVTRVISSTSKGVSEDTLRQISPERRLLAHKSSVPDEIYKILGISDPRILTSTIISRQDLLNEILFETPSERKKRILGLIGLDKLEASRERLRELRSRVERDIGVASEALGRKKFVEEMLSRINGEISSLRKELEKIEAERNRLQNAISELQERVKNLREVSQKIADLRSIESSEKQLEEKKGMLREVEERLTTLEKIDLSEVRRLKDEIRSVRSDIERLSRDLDSVKRDIDESMNKLDGVLEDIKRVGHDVSKRDLIDKAVRSRLIESLENSLGKLVGELDLMRAYAEIHRIFLEGFKESDRCPICGSPLSRDKLDHLVREHREKLSQLEKIIKEKEDRRRFLERAIKDLRNTLARVDLLEDSLLKITKELEEAGARLNNLLGKCVEKISLADSEKKQIASPSGGVDSEKCVSLLDRLLADAEAYRAKLDTLKRDIEGLERELSNKKGFSESLRRDIVDGLTKVGLESFRGSSLEEIQKAVNEALGKADSELDKLRGEFDSLVRGLGELEGALRSRERDKEAGLRELERLKSVEADLDALKKISDVLSRLEELLKKDGIIAKRMTIRVRDVLQMETNKILRDIGKSFSIEINEEFEFQVSYGKDGKRPVENLSGGEKTVLSIALRLALAKILMGRIPRFMILDEPTQNLDQETRSTIFDTIKRIAGGMDQVILVTHDQEIEQKADHVIKVQNINGVSKVESLGVEGSLPKHS